MFHNLEEDQSILNFSYLTAVFYQFFTISVKNFEKMNLQESKYEINKEFDDLNLNNLMDYLGYMSDLTKNDEVTKQKKKIYLKQFLILILMKMKKTEFSMNVVKK